MLSTQTLNNLQKQYSSTSEQDIFKESEALVTEFAAETLVRVEAYSAFQREHGGATGCDDIADFLKLQPVDKDNYLREHTVAELISGSTKEKAWHIASTSGSTGNPFYFPRSDYGDEVYAATAEAYLVDIFDIQTKKTLYINAFPLGVWIGGLFTFSAISKLMQRGYNIDLINPGISKSEIIKTIKNLQGDYEQIVIGSYAPFLKDILEDGIHEGVDWKKNDYKFVFSAEAFSEEFRDYVCTITGCDTYQGTLNHYGTVDLGTMAHETPLSILVRRLAYKDKKLFSALFGQIQQTPTLAQYDPRLFYFEAVDGQLLCSAKTEIPLIRYDLKDRGGVYTFAEVVKICAEHGYDLLGEYNELSITSPIWNLPFVYVYERADLSVSYYAFQIYPEIIRIALQNKELQGQVSGKFTMEVAYVEGRQRLNLYVEKRPDAQADVEKVTNHVHETLKQKISEYKKTCEEVGDEQVKPVLTIIDYEDQKYFKPGAKQKWVKK